MCVRLRFKASPAFQPRPPRPVPSLLVFPASRPALWLRPGTPSCLPDPDARASPTEHAWEREEMLRDVICLSHVTKRSHAHQLAGERLVAVTRTGHRGQVLGRPVLEAGSRWPRPLPPQAGGGGVPEGSQAAGPAPAHRARHRPPVLRACVPTGKRLCGWVCEFVLP